MSQSSIVIQNAPGATVRASINAALQAITECQSGATAPATTYPNMFWFDTSTGLLKRRTNANDAWITVGLEAADTDGALFANSDSKIATQKATKTYADTKIPSTYLDTDVALTANSDTKIPSQKAIKTYADGKLSKTTSGEINALTEKATPLDNDIMIIEDSAASFAKKKAKLSSIKGIVESWISGTSGYVIYSNGLIEQWGEITTTTNASSTFALHKAMSNTNYLIIVSNMADTNAICRGYASSTTVFGASCRNGANQVIAQNLKWHVIGY